MNIATCCLSLLRCHDVVELAAGEEGREQHQQAAAVPHHCSKQTTCLQPWLPENAANVLGAVMLQCCGVPQHDVE